MRAPRMGCDAVARRSGRVALLVVGGLLGTLVLPGNAAVAAGHRLATVVSADPADWTPNVLDGRVYAFAQVGSKVVVGGTFTQVQAAGGGPILSRTSIFSFDASTGTIDPAFAPTMDGDVWTLEPAADGHSVYAGGSFSHVNGALVRKLVELNVSTGQRVPAFAGTADAVVRDLELQGGSLYVAGAFHSLDGVVRTNLGRVDALTGSLDGGIDLAFGGPRLGATSVHHIDISPNGQLLVAVGNFTTVAGLRRSQVVMLNLATSPASVGGWESDRFDDVSYPHCSDRVDSYVRDVAFSPDGGYFVTVTTGGPSGAARTGTVCDAASRWETTGGAHSQPTWVAYTGGDTFWSVAVTGTAVYVGGHQRWLNNSFAAGEPGPGAVARPGIAALDPRNGLPLAWNPTRDRGVGAFVLYATDQGLWVGSDTDHVGHEYHGKMALLPTSGGSTPADDRTGSLPSPLITVPRMGKRLAKHPVSGSGFGAPSVVQTSIEWDQVRGAMLMGNLLYTAGTDGRLMVRAFDSSTGASGPPSVVSLLGLDANGLDDDLAAMTGMFFDSSTGRWYYTVAGDGHLYYRYFTVDSQTIGAERFVAATGAVWGELAGMTVASGHLYFADASGNLWRMSWSGGPTGVATRIGGPAVDGRAWRTHGMFVAT
jgi:hypothetical protein